MEKNKELPKLPSPIQEFVVKPEEGKFALRAPISFFNLMQETICCKNNRIYFVPGWEDSPHLYKKELPSRDFLSSLKSPLTDEDVLKLMGNEPELMYYKDGFSVEEKSNQLTAQAPYHSSKGSAPVTTRVYDFFTLNKQSKVVTMHIVFDYTSTEAGENLVKNIFWNFGGTRVLIAEKEIQPINLNEPTDGKSVFDNSTSSQIKK